MNESNKLTIKIIKDNDGTPVELNNMPLNAGDSLASFIINLSKIAKSQTGSERLHLDIRSGCAEVSLVGEETDFEELERDLDSVISRESKNSELVKAFREIQNIIKANGLTYQVLIKKGNEISRNLTTQFRESKRFITVTDRIQQNHSIVFLEGEFFQNGGLKNANFHLNVADTGQVTIACTKEQAKELDGLLYSNLKISAWKSMKRGLNPSYTLCDKYLNDLDYTFFQEKISEYNEAVGTERHHVIFNTFNELYINNPESIIKGLLLFNHKTIEKGYLHTIFIALKGLEHSPKTLEIIEEMKNSYYK